MCGNGSCKSTGKCKSKICKLKSNFVSRNKAVSTSGKGVGFVVPNETIYVDCNSPNVIYLITRKRCSLEHVGETAQKIKGLTSTELVLTNPVNVVARGIGDKLVWNWEQNMLYTKN